jgi:hypothetical protein
MKKWYLVLPLVLLLSGCSWISELMLFNRSDVKVKVWFRYGTGYTGNAIIPPHAYTITAWENDVPVLGDTAAVHSLLEGDSLWYVELPPQTAVVLSQSTNENFEDQLECRMILNQLQVLKVLGPNDTIFTCARTGCLPRLKVMNRARAGIVYE